MPMNATHKILLPLIALSLVDAVIPLPILGCILIYVVSYRPPWFLRLVRGIYHDS